MKPIRYITVLIPLMLLFLNALFIYGNDKVHSQLWTYTNKPVPYIANQTVIPIAIDDSFYEERVAEINQAIVEWNHVLNGQIVMKVLPLTFKGLAEGKDLIDGFDKTGLGIAIFAIDSDSKILDGIGESTLAFVKGTDAHAVVVIIDRIGTRNLKVILEHELGHILGAMHVNAMSLEYPAYKGHQAGCIDKITVAQVAEEQGLDLNVLNYCRMPNFE